MQPELYAHPFSSYCQKALVALYENDTPFSFRVVDLQDDADTKALEALWPMKRFPVLVDGGRVVIESSIIIEYLQRQYPGPVTFVPIDPDEAQEVRFMDRVFDNYVMTPIMRIVFDRMRPDDGRDPIGVEQGHQQLETAYRWLDGTLADRDWAAGPEFSMADCAAAPSLFYADWVHEIAPEYENVRRYRARLLARPSFARAVDEARPHRPFFPGGAPDRD